MPRIRRKLLALTAATLFLSGCGDSADTPPAGSSPPASPAPPSSSAAASSPASAPSAATSLTVEFSPDGTAVGDTYTLECDGAAPVAGSRAPDPAAACAAVAAKGTALFAPPPADLVCTQMIAGMQRAQVSGEVAGEAVDGQFSLTNGCEISRWEGLTGLLGPATGIL